MYYVYVLMSKKDNLLYTGSTRDLKKRFLLHNSGKVVSTKLRTPFTIVYYEAYSSERDARKREHNLKLRSNAFIQMKRRIYNSLRKECGGKC